MDETTARYHRLRALFDEALRKDPSARHSYLDQACSDDPTLRPELQRLLDAHQQARSFLERPVAFMPPSWALDDEEFPGSERFTVLRRLGAGGMGVVYEVRDLARGEIVALKTLRSASPAGVYRLKHEFRSLAGVAHPNVVCLYELFVEDARCFFTMEQVKGVNFVDYVRGGDRAGLSIDRLTSALRQLLDGVSAVHRLGKLHRDIKPSNVLVTPEGRVVILDFGLITELFPDTLGASEQIIGGTPAYIAPEDRPGMRPSEAGDWYSVGATLYEALTGEIPFRGPPIEVLLRKRECDPLPPSELAPDVPADLSAICMGLMCREPTRRLSGRDVLGRLRGGPRPAPSLEEAVEPLPDAPFVGRTRELEVLSDAYVTVTRGRAAAVYVCGPSGIGKSALVRAFLGRLTTRDDVVVLSGRCYAHESVPYKALDGVVDSLSRYLVLLSEQAAEDVLPRDIVALPRMFPVMLRVPSVAKACQEREPPLSEPFLLRGLGFEVLRELLTRIADRRRLVISIDDLQWADVDGARLLEGLLRPPDAPALLTVVSFRSEEVAGNPFLQRLLESGRDLWTPLPLEPMPEAEAGELVARLVPADSPLSEAQKRQITREASGSPLVLEQLTRYASVNRTDPSRGPTFAEMFDARLGALSADARCFLETLATCGRPMAPELVCAACGVARERQSMMAMLRSLNFIRSSGSSERVETYHDRIREVLAAQIAPDAVRRIHGLMVRALVEGQSDDCEELFEHYRGAGDHENASVQAGLAAAKAGTALAFDRAAFFFGQALALAPASPAAAAWKEGFADALANAGRPEEAADAYLRAAAGASHPHRVELQRRGAQQFLIGGHIDRGLDLTRTMLAGMGVRVPRSPHAALLSLLSQRARLRWRGLSFVPRQVEDIDPDTLLRLDTCWSAATGLALVDMIGASDFSARHVLMALDAGEPSRIARAMALESAARAAYPTGRKLSEKLAQQSTVIAKSVGNPQVVALSLLAEGYVAMCAGEWQKASVLSRQALAILRDRPVGAIWELNLAQNLAIWSLMYMGELAEVSRQVPALLANARSRGNLYIATELCTRCNYVWLVADDPDEGEREAVESIERWSQKGFHRQHYSAMLARVQTALYRGDGEAAWRLLAEQQSTLRRSLITRVQVFRVESLYLQARSALAMAASNRGSRRFLSVARAGARRIARERRPWSDPIALLLRAGIAYVEGSTPLALRCLHDAAHQFDRADMKLYAAVARRRIGTLQDDAPGSELRRQAEEWMATQQIKNPVAMTRMLAPGFSDVA
jgi:eukaryotic-like serine/threonine-protein kinase